ncbi:epoxyqueuosine reductase [Clostridium manihotivorum]|uniref:Fe-S oxidoreductase n=1 Tax=Clostridium manihotivorum TaxID=2320868 RepID=A0A3R5QZ02_9CLOT|nr:epoxyqueuosine reductase [Clostridium manihotivorum]QAA32882.1 Fe-S oxidoreductase [Clostridium manihotivorum]
METIEQLIQKKAYELGYEKCGIIPLSMIDGYKEKLDERIKKVPESEQFYKGQQRLANPLADYPWAKSVVVMAVPYGKYKVPEQVKGHIAKAYLFDIRLDENAEEYKHNREIEKYMSELGLKVATNQKFGVVGMRWAALQAGLGIVRRNNFFYTKSGSWVHLEAWLTDREMELKETNDLPQCPKSCGKCIAACPTKSLSDSYTMSPTACVSFLTTFGGRDLPNQPLSKTFGSCIYGCDICQDVCPMNKGKWQENEDFPGLEELALSLTPEEIMDMDEEFYRNKIQPKFFYVSPDDLWKWKVNVLNFMRNNYKDSYRPYIIQACQNENGKIVEMATSIKKDLKI